MSKKLLLIIAALFSLDVLADTPDQPNTGQFDKKELCIYADKLYSVGSTIKADSGDTLKCYQPKLGKSGSNKIETAHWD